MSEAEDQTFAAAAAAVDAAVGEASAATVCEPAEKKSKPSKSSSRRQCRFPGCEFQAGCIRLCQSTWIAEPTIITIVHFGFLCIFCLTICSCSFFLSKTPEIDMRCGIQNRYQDHQIAGPLSKARCEGQAMQGW
mmetsp:Transcript_24166/g.49866  ORF Transcript_24166/g.49866 Transcript_24166/m.49866 type:complete len:134 (-) Transcript_24166:591-992(-)